MKSILTSLFAILSLTLFGQFSGYFAPANWSTVQSDWDSGSVDASGAPASITLHGSDNYSYIGSNIRYEIAIQICGQVTFDWYYVTNDPDGSFYDQVGYTINGNYYQLSTDCIYSCYVQSGSASVNVAPGDVFGFYAASLDNIFGAGHMTVSNFSAPDAVCYGDEGEVKVELCHSGVSICVSPNAVAAHLAHGDVYGTCEENAACEDNPAFSSHQSSGQKAVANGHEISIQSRSVSGPGLIKVYPNPASDVIHIAAGRMEGFMEISVYNIMGQLVKQEMKVAARGTGMEMSVADLPAGTYTLKVAPTFGKVITEKLLIHRN